MANANSTPIRTPLDRLKVEEQMWGKIYQGTEDDLVAAGLIKAEWLPGKPGNARTSTRVAMVDGAMQLLPRGVMMTAKQKDGPHFWLRPANKREFVVWDSLGETRWMENLERERLKRKVEKQHAEKQRALDRAPKSPQDFREDRKGLIKACLEGVFNLFRRADNGYHYSREVIEQANDLMCDLLDLAEDGKVYFDPKRQQYFLDDIEEKFEKANPEFSVFMKAALAVGKAAL